jgi:hypothetical protein
VAGPTKLATAIFSATITEVIAYLPFLMLTGNTAALLGSSHDQIPRAIISRTPLHRRYFHATARHSDRRFVFAWLSGIAFTVAFFLVLVFFIIPSLYFRH